MASVDEVVTELLGVDLERLHGAIGLTKKVAVLADAAVLRDRATGFVFEAVLRLGPCRVRVLDVREQPERLLLGLGEVEVDEGEKALDAFDVHGVLLLVGMPFWCLRHVIRSVWWVLPISLTREGLMGRARVSCVFTQRRCCPFPVR